MKRMWINQPSTKQPLNSFHGTRVLADMREGEYVTVYFLAGAAISMRVPRECLSEGWI